MLKLNNKHRINPTSPSVNTKKKKKKNSEKCRVSNSSILKLKNRINKSEKVKMKKLKKKNKYIPLL